MARVIVIGGGGFGRALVELARIIDEHTVVGFVDDRWPELTHVKDVPVVGRIADLPKLRALADSVVLAIGENRVRQAAARRANEAGFKLASLIHPRAVVSPSAMLGHGVTVMAGAIIGTEVHVEDGCIVNAGAVIDHHGRVCAFAHLGIGACMGGGAILESLSWLAVGRALDPGMRLSATGSITPLQS